jgi:homoaconitase/3-isopropylmalate dehydratase large subunit
MDRYVEAELDTDADVECFDGVWVHLSHCSACRTDHDGLLAAIEYLVSGSNRRKKP